MRMQIPERYSDEIEQQGRRHTLSRIQTASNQWQVVIIKSGGGDVVSRFRELADIPPHGVPA